jgi:UDP-N-acetylmuramate dehydrogenase
VTEVAVGALVDRAAGLLGDRVVRDLAIGPLTTYRVGGRAALGFTIEHEDDLAVLATAAAETGLPVLVVGRGSNLLVADVGFAGIAVQLGAAFAEIELDGAAAVVDAESENAVVIDVGASVLLPVLARRTVAAELTGLEWAVGVPGSVGGAVRMNAGGHGSDVAAVVTSARVGDLRDGSVRQLEPRQLGLRFRGSALRDDQIVLSARFTLARGSRAEGEAELAEVVRWRREHQPGGQNAGSVFVNPIPGVLSAGEVIDALGLRGMRLGTAQVSEKHANFIQADDGGSADDVFALMNLVRSTVLAERGISLRSEIRLVGFADAIAPLDEAPGR